MVRILTPVEQADVWRYLVLLFCGGVYVDTDVQCVTPFSQWQAALHSSKPAGLLVGLESVQVSLRQLLEVAALQGRPLPASQVPAWQLDWLLPS